MKTLKNWLLCLAFLTPLLQPLAAHADGKESDSAANTPSIEALIGDLMANVDMQLMIRIQAAMMNNLEIIGPYSEEYLTCLEAEGAFDGEGTPSLKELVEQAKRTGDTCQVILESMIGQMQFDITQEEFEQGLSPEYRELLQL